VYVATVLPKYCMNFMEINWILLLCLLLGLHVACLTTTGPTMLHILINTGLRFIAVVHSLLKISVSFGVKMMAPIP
jgi:hypothetical protein